MFIIFVTTPVPVRSSELWGTGGLSSFCDELQTIDTQALKTVFKEFLPVIEQEGIDLRQVKIVTAKDIIPLLSQATHLGWGPLELFSDVELTATKSCALLLDQQTLLEVNKKFDIHGLWMISAPIEGEENVSMEFLLLGQGKLIVGYPKQATVKVKDYDLWTGKYTYEPIMSMDIINKGNSRGLVNIKTLNIPDGKWLPFKGPFDAYIHSLEVEDGFIRVKYSKMKEVTERVPKIAISLR
jgi:hypothetical protein